MKFQHPTVLDGSVSLGDQVFPIVAGVFDAPQEIGHEMGATPLPVADQQPPVNESGLRLDGPTFEVYVAAGYAPASYPPSGYAEVPSDGLDAFRAEQAKADDAAKALDELLKGTVAEVAVAIATAADVDALAAIEEAEKKGRNRKGVLEAIDARLAALTAPKAQS